MKHREFIVALDEERIVQAVHEAEARTSGEIRVFVTRRKLRGEDVAVRAHREFRRLKMSETAQRNGVLIYVAPADRAFAVVGDDGVHAKCGQAFWDETATGMETAFRAGDFTGGVVAGVKRVGDLLSRHFPWNNDDRNELPDTIAGEGTEGGGIRLET